MNNFVVIAAAALLAGCAANPGVQAERGDSVCPGRYTLACDVSPRTGEIVAGSCSCIRTSDINSMMRSTSFGPGRSFRSRIR